MPKQEEKNNWQDFFDLMQMYDDTINDTRKQLRLPDGLWRLIRDDLRTMEDNGIKMSVNEAVVLSLMVMFNAKQNDNGFYRRKDNKAGLIHHLNKKNEEAC